MTRLEQAIWAVAYTATMCEGGPPHKNPPPIMVRDAICRADRTVLIMRETVKRVGRLHIDDQLERERVGANEPLYREPALPSEE